MLMAGTGYDIVMQDAHPLWALADSGLLTDIWTVIDSCLYFQRDDFYTHVLEAYELNGGLWAFPFSFGFKYIGINANLPQQFIDRFAVHETISVRQAISLYLDLLEIRGEFSGMLLGINEFSQPHLLFLSVIPGFIDLTNGISHILDSDLIEATSENLSKNAIIREKRK